MPAGPLRDGVLVTGLAPCEIASVATTALAGGEAAVAAGVLIGSTLATVVLAAPILTLEAGRASFSPAGVIANLAVVVALPLAAGIALRCLIPVTARFLAARRRAAGRLAHRRRRGRGAGRPGRRPRSGCPPRTAPSPPRCCCSSPATAVVGRVLGARSPRPAGAALLLTTSMRDFAIAAALAAAAFGPRRRRPARPVRRRRPRLGHRRRRRPARPRRPGPARPTGPAHTARATRRPAPCLVQPRRGRPCWVAMSLSGEERGDGHGGAAHGARRAELSYTSATSGTPLLGDTIGANFDRTAAAFPGRLALVDVPAGLRYSYAELKDEVDALAYGLLGMGIAKGDRVGIWSPNRAEWTVTQYATAKIGAILVNINPAYRTSELEFVLNQSGCKLLVAAQRLKTSDYAAMIAEVRPRCADLEQVVLLDSDAWRELLDTGKYADVSVRNAALDAIELSADDPINIQYTSGTTGFPKGATLSHHNILQQRLLRRRAVPLHGSRTGSASRCPSTTASAW